MTELSGYALETLREGSEYILYRGRRSDDADPILVLTPLHAQETPANLRWLEHEYSLADKLDPEWAVRPLALTRHDGRTMLVREDPGGDLLEGMLGRPLELTRFLRLAISLTAALRQVHRQGLIHKHIRPASVLVDAAGNVRLTGFGMASRLPRERQPPAPLDVIAGTFAYMAPEQTGRMNRSIDARSDLYSLGVILYEMLTGRASVHRLGPDRVDSLPYRPKADAAARTGRRNSGAGRSHRHEAARQDRRGSVPDRRGRRGRPSGVPGGVAGARPHRYVSARRT